MCSLRKEYIGKDVFKAIFSLVFSNCEWYFEDQDFPVMWRESTFDDMDYNRYVFGLKRSGYPTMLKHINLDYNKNRAAFFGDVNPKMTSRWRIKNLTMHHEVQFYNKHEYQKTLLPHKYIYAERYSASDVSEACKNGIYIDPETDFKVTHHRGYVDEYTFYLFITNLKTGQKTVLFMSNLYKKVVVGHSNPWNPEFFEKLVNSDRNVAIWNTALHHMHNNTRLNNWSRDFLQMEPVVTEQLFDHKESRDGPLSAFKYGVFRYREDLSKMELVSFSNVDDFRKYKNHTWQSECRENTLVLTNGESNIDRDPSTSSKKRKFSSLETPTDNNNNNCVNAKRRLVFD
jgi:hypothetical protein